MIFPASVICVTVFFLQVGAAKAEHHLVIWFMFGFMVDVAIAAIVFMGLATSYITGKPHLVHNWGMLYTGKKKPTNYTYPEVICIEHF